MLDGYETTLRLRQQERYRGLYITAMTANSKEGDVERCMAAGMDDYMRKPALEAELVAVIKRAAQALETRGADMPGCS